MYLIGGHHNNAHSPGEVFQNFYHFQGYNWASPGAHPLLE